MIFPSDISKEEVNNSRDSLYCEEATHNKTLLAEANNIPQAPTQWARRNQKLRGVNGGTAHFLSF